MYDAVVVGAGAGGAAAAGVLAEAGKSVLVIERGLMLKPADDPRDHLAAWGAPVRASDATPAHQRPLDALDSEWRFVGGVGGGTLVWGMQAWRFHPADFRMASRYGVPIGSSLADWPISYSEIEPWYARAERELGVAGDVTPYAPRSAPYPLEPFAEGPLGTWLRRGADELGWDTFTPPLAVNTGPFAGRRGCIRCRECLGFACPVDAKNGSHNTFLPRAIATGLCTITTGAQATRLVTDAAGRVAGVEYAVAEGGGRARRVAAARCVVLAGGAIETARLLLLSKSRVHPQGIGNEHDQVGRHLQGHTYASALGLLPDDVTSQTLGPGVNIATTRYNHGNPGVVGGAMMADDFIKTPLDFWQRCLPPEVPRWGQPNLHAMRTLYGRTVDVRAPVQEVPSPENRVRLSARIRDSVGQPIAHVSGVVHSETLKTADFIQDRLVDWLVSSGAEKTWIPAPAPRALSDWFHQAGTCRMSDDPTSGVVDPSGRVHGHDNLFIADGSIHVTNGGFNPALTIVSMALRTAEQLAANV
jgi:choline dehydrogenase-like flavoprotein